MIEMGNTIVSPYSIDGCTLQNERKKWLRNQFPRLKGKVRRDDRVYMQWYFNEKEIVETITLRDTGKQVIHTIPANESEQQEVIKNIHRLYKIVDQGYLGMEKQELYRFISSHFKDIRIQNGLICQYSSYARVCILPDGTYSVCEGDIGDFPNANRYFADQLSAFIKRNRLTWIMT